MPEGGLSTTPGGASGWRPTVLRMRDNAVIVFPSPWGDKEELSGPGDNESKLAEGDGAKGGGIQTGSSQKRPPRMSRTSGGAVEEALPDT